jgi:hypothetical protein
MVDQTCHVSFVRGINNHFLADFEKLCSKKDSIDVVMSDENIRVYSNKSS